MSKWKFEFIKNRGQCFRKTMADKPIPWSCATIADAYGNPKMWFVCAIDEKEKTIYINPEPQKVLEEKSCQKIP